jgi:hypothetical protein
MIKFVVTWRVGEECTNRLEIPAVECTGFAVNEVLYCEMVLHRLQPPTPAVDCAARALRAP